MQFQCLPQPPQRENMKYNPAIHHRRSIRLRGYDYTQVGAYFVTICTQNRECSLGEIVNGEMRLNDAGWMVVAQWCAMGQRFPDIALGDYVVMPNHIHGIVTIVASQNPTSHAPTLGEVVRAFKAVATRGVRQSVASGFGWQRNYYEHIIRDEVDLSRICEYIGNNPAQWELDSLHPAKIQDVP